MDILLMKLSIDRTTLLAIAIPLAALLLVGYVSYKNTIQFIQWDALGDRINLTIQKLEHLISTITDAQTYERSFIITGRVNYLEPYNSAVRNIHNQLANLNMLMADGPVNQQRLNELNILKGLIEAKLAELNKAITLRQSNRINAALPMILGYSTKIRATALDIQNQQNSIMSSATEQSEAYAQILIQTIIIATLVAAGITGVSLFVINRAQSSFYL